MTGAQELIIQQRQQAASLFQSTFGNFFGNGSSTYQVMGVGSDGMIQLQDLSSGKATSFDPLSIFGTNTSTTNNPTTQDPSGGGGGNMLSTLMGAGSAASGLLGFLKKPPSAPMQSTVQRDTPSIESELTTPGGSNTIPSGNIPSPSGSAGSVFSRIGPQFPAPDNLLVQNGMLPSYIDPHDQNLLVTYKTYQNNANALEAAQTAITNNGGIISADGSVIGMPTLKGFNLTAYYNLLDQTNSAGADYAAARQQYYDYFNPPPADLTLDLNPEAPPSTEGLELGSSLNLNAETEMFTPDSQFAIDGREEFNELELPSDQAQFNSVVQDFNSDPSTYTTEEYQNAYSELQKQGKKAPWLDDNPDAVYNQAALDRQQAMLSGPPSIEETSRYLDGLSPDDRAALEQLPIPEQQKIEAYGVNNQRLQDYKDAVKSSLLSSERNKFLGSLAGAAGSGYGLFESIFSMTENGNPTAGGIIGALGSITGLIVSMKMMHSALVFANSATPLMVSLNNIPVLNFLHLGSAFKFLTSMPGMIAVMAAVTLLAVLLGRKSPEEQAADELNQDVSPSVWTNGPVMMITAGMALASMGINLGPNAPLMQTIAVPEVQATQALQNATGQQIPTDSSRYSTVFVQQGSGGQPTRVVYLTYSGTDSAGNAVETAHLVTLDGGLQFQDPGSSGYIPFFAKDSRGNPIANPQAVASINAQGNLLKGSGAVNTTQSQQLVQIAGASNKNGVSSANMPVPAH